MKSSWMLVAGLFFAVMGTCVKIGSAHFPALELVFYRPLFGLIAIIRWRGGSLATDHLRMHFSRGIAGLASLSFYFYAMAQLPVATAVTLNYTSPMFLTLITLLWYRERVRPQLLVAVLLGFVGVIPAQANHRNQLPAGLLGLTSGFLASLAYVSVKQLSLTGEPDRRVVFYFCLISTIISGAILCFGQFHPIDWRGGALLLAIGVSATIAQLALTRAYRVGKILVVGAFAYSTVVFAAVLGVLLLHELLPIASWIGIAIIIAAGLFATRESASTSD